MEKTPVSILYELCVKHKSIPIFEDLSHEFDSSSEYRVKAFGLEVIAHGDDNNTAKQNAAKRMLKVIEESNILSNKDASFVTKIATFVNYVGALQEFCLRQKLPPPNFEFLRDVGKKKFLVTCSVGEIEACAKEDSKKAGKHAVAKLMMEKLLQQSKKETLPFTAGGTISQQSHYCCFNLDEDQVEAVKVLLANETSTNDKKVVTDACDALQIPWKQSQLTSFDGTMEVFEMDIVYNYFHTADSVEEIYGNAKAFLANMVEAARHLNLCGDP